MQWGMYCICVGNSSHVILQIVWLLGDLPHWQEYIHLALIWASEEQIPCVLVILKWELWTSCEIIKDCHYETPAVKIPPNTVLTLWVLILLQHFGLGVTPNLHSTCLMMVTVIPNQG